MILILSSIFIASISVMLLSFITALVMLYKLIKKMRYDFKQTDNKKRRRQILICSIIQVLFCVMIWSGTLFNIYVTISMIIVGVGSGLVLLFGAMIDFIAMAIFIIPYLITLKFYRPMYEQNKFYRFPKLERVLMILIFNVIPIIKSILPIIFLISLF